MEYMVLAGSQGGQDNLEDKVHEAMNDGWEPLWGVAFSRHINPGEESLTYKHDFHFAQAMIKR